MYLVECYVAGNCPVLPSSIPKPPTRLASTASNRGTMTGSAAATAAALNAQAVPYVPHGMSHESHKEQNIPKIYTVCLRQDLPPSSA